MNNRDIYQKDPSTRKLVNEGVANVNDEPTNEAMAVLRYELETFVCDGQYGKGLYHILDTYLRNVNQVQQPGVWISGFYGSGKSHLVKMLRALWVDYTFPDGATARGIANLPAEIQDFFKELSTQGKRHGGLHAASGTLGSGASGSVRLALLRILFKSVGLPEQYSIARFVMWLQQEGLYDPVRAAIDAKGGDWSYELDNFYVAELLHEVLAELKPNLFSSPLACAESLNNLYPFVQDISSDEMLKAIKQALTRDGKFPLTLIVLDEVQQYIGEDSQRSIDVQEVVEACCKNFAGKLLFIATGQTAVSGTSNLKKLEGRFTVRVELSDSDVDAVIRKVILSKKPEAIQPIDSIMETNLGEISRQLAGTTIGHRLDDSRYFSKDYPILPIRRRFWEMTLRVLDQTGTDSQLRNQLSMVHKVIQTNLDAPLGTVVPADYLYFDAAEKLLQARILPRKVYDNIMIWSKGTSAERLTARAAGLVFLINKVSSTNKEVGIKATVDSLADLMVEDLGKGSASLRSQLPALLDACELLIKVGDEYRIQTEESAAWSDEFQKQRSILHNQSHRIESERDDRLRKAFARLVPRLSVMQGASRVLRDIVPVFDSQLPPDADGRIYAWVRTGWNSDENSVRADARLAGTQSPTIFVFVPKRSADDLRHQLIDFKASSATLGIRGTPNTPEGMEAMAYMETVKKTAEERIREFLEDSLGGARVFQGGGAEVVAIDLQEMILEAAGASLGRLYPQFHVADHVGWAKAYERAQKGAPDSLKAVGDEGEAEKNPVCKALLSAVGPGKSGADLRTQFESSPCGWSRDAVDGGLQVLLVAGLLKATDERGRPVDYKELERKSIGKTYFRVESATVTTPQRIQIRKLFQKAGMVIKQGEEHQYVSSFVQKLIEMADNAGGEAPKPKRPDTAFLEPIRLSSGNEQLLALFNSRELITACIENWAELAGRIGKRWHDWLQLKQLASHARGLKDADVLLAQVSTIENQRLLIEEPDMIAPLLASFAQLLRGELGLLKQLWDSTWAQGEQKLQEDANWAKLEPEQRYTLRSRQQLVESAVPQIDLGTSDRILDTLERFAIPSLKDRIAAMPSRFDGILLEAAKLNEPTAHRVVLPNATLKTPEEVDQWLSSARETLTEALKKGPVIVR